MVKKNDQGIEIVLTLVVLFLIAGLILFGLMSYASWIELSNGLDHVCEKQKGVGWEFSKVNGSYHILCEKKVLVESLEFIGEAHKGVVLERAR